MSEKRFLELLQELLTMVDPDDPDSIKTARSVISGILELAKESGKVYSPTIRMMISAEEQFLGLVRHKDEFAGWPGDYWGNVAKQHRLMQMLRPADSVN